MEYFQKVPQAIA